MASADDQICRFRPPAPHAVSPDLGAHGFRIAVKEHRHHKSLTQMRSKALIIVSANTPVASGALANICWQHEMKAVEILRSSVATLPLDPSL